MPSLRFKALLFDFDETLVPEYELADVALRELFAEISASHSSTSDLELILREVAGSLVHDFEAGRAAAEYFGRPATYWYAYELVWDDKYPLYDIADNVPEFRHAVWTETFARAGINDPALSTSLASRLPALVHERRVPYKDSDPVLAEFSRHYAMAIITNGEPSVQARKVENSGLRHHFQQVILANEHGGKPNLGPFEAAMDLLGCRPEEAAMIGNSLANDIAGAKNAGIYSVLVDRAAWRENPADGLVPDATVNELTELLDLFNTD